MSRQNSQKQKILLELDLSLFAFEGNFVTSAELSNDFLFASLNNAQREIELM